MLITTRRAAAAASAARLMCPACRLPIVGTKATRSPAARHPATAARNSPIASTMRTRANFSSRGTMAASLAARSLEAVFGRGVAAILDGVHVSSQRVERRVAPFREILGEARHSPLRDAEHVVEHEDLRSEE